MKKILYILNLLYLFSILILTGCAHGHFKVDFFNLPKGATVSVLPFQNLTSYPRAGKIVSEIMALELSKIKEIKISDPSLSEAKLSRDKRFLTQEEGFRETDFGDIGKLLNASYILTGSVNEYRYTKGLAEAPTVAIQVKLIDVRTQQTVWRASASDLSTESVFNRSASLDELTHTLCASIITHLN